MPAFNLMESLQSLVALEPGVVPPAAADEGAADATLRPGGAGSAPGKVAVEPYENSRELPLADFAAGGTGAD